jgi:hypothetical protein
MRGMDLGEVRRFDGRSPIERAHDAERAPVHDVSVDHGGPHVLVSEQRLEGTDVRARFKEVGGEAVTQRRAGPPLVELRRPRRLVDGLLHRGLVQVVENGPARRWVGAGPRGRKQVLPRKRRRRVGHLGAESVRQIDLTAAGCEFGLVSPLHLVELRLQAVAGPRRQKCSAVVTCLAAADHDLAAFEVHVLDLYGEAFEQAEAATVKDLPDEPERGFELIEEGEDVAAREDRRQVVGALRTLKPFQGGPFQAEHTPVQEDEGAEGLVLGGGRDPAQRLRARAAQNCGRRRPGWTASCFAR